MSAARRRTGDSPEQAALRAAEMAGREALRAGERLARFGDLLYRAGLPKGRPSRLTRKNTAPHSVERAAVNRVTYERRKAGRRPGETVRAALGHSSPESRRDAVSVYVADPARLLLGVEVDHRTAARIGRYMEAVRRLLDGRLTDDAFKRRFARWAPVVVFGPPEVAGTYLLLADPDAVRALAEAARGQGVEVVFDSGRRRPVQRRTPPRRRPRGRT